MAEEEVEEPTEETREKTSRSAVMKSKSATTPTGQETKSMMMKMQWSGGGWKEKHPGRYGDSGTNTRVCAPVEAPVALLKDMVGPNKVKEFKKMWALVCQTFR